MAPALWGKHACIRCADCGMVYYRCLEGAADGGAAVCPNCGYAGNEAEGRQLLPGERVMVFRSLYQFRRPRRWEVVAMRNPRDASQVVVKRVVGLPGETIQIHHGDVYADGQVQRKSLAQQRAMAILVHDADYSPALNKLPPRWMPESQETHWGWADGRYVHAAGDPRDPVDWLVYRHWRRVGAGPQIEESPITDDSPGCPAPRRAEDCSFVPDVMLSFRVTTTFGRGLLLLRATDGREQFQVHIDPNARRYWVLHNGRQVLRSGGMGKTPVLEGGVRIELSLFDQQFLLAIDGKTALALPYEAGTSPRQPTARPLAIGSQGLGLELRELRVYRDVYYGRLAAAAAPWAIDKPVKVANWGYFVLGDNSPVSLDSRCWPEGPTADAQLLVGKPLVVLLSPGGAQWLDRWFKVPDLTRIRYIR
jgi:signal peptidase I